MQKTCVILKDNRREEVLPCCPFCNAGDVIRYGFQKNKVQRYLCNSCDKIFNQRYGTLFYGKHLSDNEILRVVYLFLTGYPLSHMPPLFDVTEKTLRGILKEALSFRNSKNTLFFLQITSHVL